MPLFLSDFYRWNSFRIFLPLRYNRNDTYDKCQKNNYHPNKGEAEMYILFHFILLYFCLLWKTNFAISLSQESILPILFCFFTFVIGQCALKSWKNVKLNIVRAILQMQV